MSLASTISDNTIHNKPGYKHTKLGWIPEGWKVVKIKTLSKVVTGSTPSTNDHTLYGQEYLFVSPVDLGEHKYADDSAKKLSFYGFTSSRKIPKGSILFTCIGSTIGKTAIAASELTTNQQINSIFPGELHDSDFLYYELNSLAAKIKRLAAEQAVPLINKSEFQSLEIKLPPLPEQQKIAEILSIWDTGIAKIEELIAQKQSLKKGLMQQLLTGKKRFAEFIKSDKIKTTKLGEIPKDWDLISLSQVPNKKVKWSLTGGPFGSDLKSSDYTSRGIRILQLQNLGDGKFVDDYKIYTSEKKADSLLACNIFPGEIIMSKMGDPVARACLIPETEKRFLMASDGIRLVPDSHDFDTNFVLFFINYSLFRRLAIRNSTGSTRQRIGLGDLKKLPFIKPELVEQKKIAAVLSTIEMEIESLQRESLQLKEQKKGLMQKLLTGAVRVKIDKAI